MLKPGLTIFRMLVAFVNKVYLRVNMCDGFLATWLGIVQKRCDTKGTVDAIGWLKALRLAYHGHLSGAPLSTTPGFGVELDSDGLPVKEDYLNQLFLSRDPAQVRKDLTWPEIPRRDSVYSALYRLL